MSIKQVNDHLRGLLFLFTYGIPAFRGTACHITVLYGLVRYCPVLYSSTAAAAAAAWFAAGSSSGLGCSLPVTACPEATVDVAL